jgi:hypothetical protein
MYELAAVTPALEKFYNEAADAYAQTCQQYAQTMINYVRIFPSTCSLMYNLLKLQVSPKSIKFSNKDQSLSVM